MAGRTRGGGIALIYTTSLKQDDPDPALSTMAQAHEVERALLELGWKVEIEPFHGDLNAHEKRLTERRPDLVFNLVEAMLETDRFAYIAATMYENLRIPFTGSGSSALFAASDKVMAKRFLSGAGLMTPGFSAGPDWEGIDEDRLYIVKSTTEHASLGLDAGAVVRGRHAIIERVTASRGRWDVGWFAEEFVEGREFNVGVLDLADGARAMPLAEMTFDGFPEGRPRIVDHAAKWREDSMEYKCTVRRFLDEAAEPDLARAVRHAAETAWKLFGMGGWGRIDMRIDAEGRPYVIDVNVNPDISMDAGMAAGAERAGYPYVAMIGEIVEAAFRRRYGA